jgi:uncharacterized OsmC-like protein
MSTNRPPTFSLNLAWEGELRFAGTAGQIKMLLDGIATAGPSPVQALAFGLASCMAIDIVHILTKSRLPLQGLQARLDGERRGEDPKHFTRIALHFVVSGPIPDAASERLIPSDVLFGLALPSTGHRFSHHVRDSASDREAVGIPDGKRPSFGPRASGR